MQCQNEFTLVGRVSHLYWHPGGKYIDCLKRLITLRCNIMKHDAQQKIQLSTAKR